MKLDISQIVKLNGASLDFIFNEPLFELSHMVEDLVFDKPLDFKGTLVNNSGVLKLEGDLKLNYTAKCFRCIKDLQNELDIHIHEDIVDGRNNPGSDNYTYEGNDLTLDKIVKDNILLNLPARHVCGEHCKGLCCKCGTNLNAAACNCEDDTTNPQMEVLKNFFKQ